MLTATSAGNVRMTLPQGLTISNASGANFVGDFYAPSFIEGATPLDLGIPGNVTNLTAFEIGLEDAGLFFNNPVRLLFPGQGGKEFGWSSDGSFHESTLLSADDGALLALLGVTDGYLTVGDDLIVWSTHFTKFAMFTPSTVPISPTVWLLGSGLVGLAGLRRKFKKGEGR